MPSLPVVEDLQVLEDRVRELHSGVPPLSIQQLDLHPRPEGLDDRVGDQPQNVVIGFAFARRRFLDIDVPGGDWKSCRVCERSFREDSLAPPAIARMGMDHLEICPPCLGATVINGVREFWETYRLEGHQRSNCSAEEVLEYAVRISTAALGRVPRADFGSRTADIRDLDPDTRVAVIKVMIGRPSPAAIVRLHSSWRTAVLKAGLPKPGRPYRA